MLVPHSDHTLVVLKYVVVLGLEFPLYLVYGT
jgi:hypothetical protein